MNVNELDGNEPESKFGAAQQIPSKAQQMLGVGKLNLFAAQKEGWMLKRPFTKKSGGWQKRYFVLKDSFLTWYDHEPRAAYGIHPKGVLPLGGCGVFPCGMVDGDYYFEITHMDWRGHRLLLRTAEKQDTDDWMKVLSDCRIATWHNAVLGDAMLEKMKHKGTILEKEKSLAVEKAQAEAERSQTSRKEKEYAAMDAETTVRHMQLMAQTAKEESQFVSQQLKSKTEQLKQEQECIKEEQDLLEEYEENLQQAKAAVERLRDLLSAKGGNEALLEKTKRLQIFFDSSIEDVGEDQKYLTNQTMMSVAVYSHDDRSISSLFSSGQPHNFDASLFEDLEESDTLLDKIRHSLGSQGRSVSGSIRKSMSFRSKSPAAVPAMPPRLPPRSVSLCDDDV